MASGLPFSVTGSSFASPVASLNVRSRSSCALMRSLSSAASSSSAFHTRARVRARPALPSRRKPEAARCATQQQEQIHSGLTAEELRLQEHIRQQAREHPGESQHLTVADCMTQGQLVVAKAGTEVFQALEWLVEHRITGMPVVDEQGRVVGVVSDYDMLALDSISHPSASSIAPRGSNPENDLFPAPSSSWKAFREIQKLLHKSHGQRVGDVMTPHPLTVRPMTNLEDAARLLLDSSYRRLPVVDEAGKLVGLLTRGNVIRAALMLRRASMGFGAAAAGGN